MRRRPHLPPAGRGQAALRLTSAAAHGEFRLPVCNGCGHVQYPPAEFCQSCLSDDLTWAKVAPEGGVLATTDLENVKKQAVMMSRFGVAAVKVKVVSDLETNQSILAIAREIL